MISNVSRREELLNAPGVSTANRISNWIDVASTTGGWGGRLTSYRAIGVCATPSRAVPGEVSGPRNTGAVNGAAVSGRLVGAPRQRRLEIRRGTR
jgi:hypothetical protein